VAIFKGASKDKPSHGQADGARLLIAHIVAIEAKRPPRGATFIAPSWPDRQPHATA
jgi:hypothetical protein